MSGKSGRIRRGTGGLRQCQERIAKLWRAGVHKGLVGLCLYIRQLDAGRERRTCSQRDEFGK